MKKKILVIGATGAMGQYLVPALAEMDVEIDAISLDEKESTQLNVRYFKANAKDRATLMGFQKNHYDCIVDFMTYPTNTLATMMPLMTSFTDQYVYLSSCRVFANEENPIVESSPRLIQAPRAQAAERQESVSSETSGALMMEEPFARAAMASARMVWDLDPGTAVSPLICECLTDKCMMNSVVPA